MPLRGTDGSSRAELIEPYIEAMNAWCRGDDLRNDELHENVFEKLGKSDREKGFLVSLFASLLRAQVLAARDKDESRKA